MSKSIYKAEFTAFLNQHNLGTPAAAIERLRCLGLRFQDSKVRDLVKHPDHGGQPVAYLHHKASRRIVGKEWMDYKRLCELLLKARDKYNEAAGVEPKQSKEDVVETEIKAYEMRVLSNALETCGDHRCRISETSHGRESGNLWIKFHPKAGPNAGLVHGCASLISRSAFSDGAVIGHKIKVTTVLDCNFCQITVDSGHVRAAITAEVEKRLGEKQGALPIEETGV
jgi:hypothetical protein